MHKMGRGSGGNAGRPPQQQNTATHKSATKGTPIGNSMKNNSKNDDSISNSITMTRAKRTPKPNRKYINDEVISMRSKISSSRSNSPDSEDFDDDDDDDVNIVLDKKYTTNKGTGKDSDTEMRGRVNLRKKVMTPTATIRPVAQIAKPMQTATPTTNRKIYEMRDLTARNKEPNTPVMIKRTPVQQESVNRTTRVNVVPKKRTPKNEDIDFEMPSNDEDDADDDEDFEEEKPPRVVRRTRQVGSVNNNVTKITQPIRQITRVATSTTIGSTSITPTISRGSTATTAPSNIKITHTANTLVKKQVMSRPVQMSPHFKLTESTTTNKSNSVHSFTIVNINDIIKKGPEAPLKKRKLLDSNTPEVPDSKRKRLTEAIEKSRDKHNSSMEDDLDLDLDLDDDDVELIEVKENKKSGNFNRNTTNSRRKTQHTTILTDDFEAKIKTNQLHKSTLVQQSLINNNNNNGKFKENDKKYEVTQQQSKNSGSKPPPRILNSMLGRRPITKQSDLVGEFDIKQSKSSSSPIIEMKSTSDSVPSAKSNTSANNISSVTKDNLKTYKGSNLVNQQRKLESLMDSKPKIVYEEQDGKRVKKITCFETWYVINIPTIEVPTQKPLVNVSLTKIGNEAKQIMLPSNRWTYRITLSKLKNEPTDELYTGEVQDDHIKESEKHLYEPTNIMFRRRKAHASLNMQYDRAIIFKNSTYFLNIDGKSVKLLGSPQTIKNFSEVETLLQIVDDISLVNSCVEPTNYGS